VLNTDINYVGWFLVQCKVQAPIASVDTGYVSWLINNVKSVVVMLLQVCK
jgi:hypothetical protein